MQGDVRNEPIRIKGDIASAQTVSARAGSLLSAAAALSNLGPLGTNGECLESPEHYVVFERWMIRQQAQVGKPL
jgi:hypothetical protein